MEPVGDEARRRTSRASYRSASGSPTAVSRTQLHSSAASPARPRLPSRMTRNMTSVTVGIGAGSASGSRRSMSASWRATSTARAATRAATPRRRSTACPNTRPGHAAARPSGSTAPAHGPRCDRTRRSSRRGLPARRPTAPAAWRECPPRRSPRAASRRARLARVRPASARPSSKCPPPSTSAFLTSSPMPARSSSRRQRVQVARVDDVQAGRVKRPEIVLPIADVDRRLHRRDDVVLRHQRGRARNRGAGRDR